MSNATGGWDPGAASSVSTNWRTCPTCGMLTNDGTAHICYVQSQPLQPTWTTSGWGPYIPESQALATAIATLAASHAQGCTLGHQFPDECPLFIAWDERRPK